MTRETTSRNLLPPVWLLAAPLVPLALLFLSLELPLCSPPVQISWCSLLIIAATAALTRVCGAATEFDVFEPLYLVYGVFLVSYPIRALLAVWLDESWFDPYKAAVWAGLWGSVLGYVCFALGYRFYSRKRGVRRWARLDRRWNSSRADAVARWFFVIGLAGFAVMYLLGGSLLYFVSLDPDTKGPQSMAAWFFYVLWACVFMQAGALIQLGNWFSTGRRTLWTAAYCGLALFSSLLLSRYFTVVFIIMLGFCWHYKRRKIKVFEIGVVFLLLLAYLGLAGLYREWISPGADLGDLAGLSDLSGQQNKIVLRYVVGDLEQFFNLSETISMTPSELPYQFGSTFAALLLKPIPRVLMPWKPLGASAVFSREIAPDEYDNGLATGLGAWGEWYLNFSWFGLVFGMGLMGALAAGAYRALHASLAFGRVLLYLSFIVVLLTWLRNDLNAASTYGLYYFLPAIAALLYITDDEPSSALLRVRGQDA